MQQDNGVVIDDDDWKQEFIQSTNKRITNRNLNKQNIHLSHVYCTSSGALVVIIPGTCWSATVILKFTSLQFYFFDFRFLRIHLFLAIPDTHQMWADMELII